MKTDTELQRDVQNELHWERSIAAADIGVTAKEGVITLTGNVPSYFDKVEAEHITGRVVGVMGIAEELKVDLPDSNERTDGDIAQSALNVLAWNVAVPRDQAKVKVESGWVTLSGQVDWHFQKMAAENAVHHLMGVTGVTNLISLKPMAAVEAAEIQSAIENAFKRTARSDAQKITVTVNNGQVTLRGKARSWTEKQEAGHSAWQTAGVSSVENDVVIAD